MRRSSRSTRGTSSFRHSSSPAPQRSNRPVIGEESGEPIFFRARWCLSEKYSANKGEPDALGTGFGGEAKMRTLLMTALCSVELLAAGQQMNVAVCNLDGVRRSEEHTSELQS